MESYSHGSHVLVSIPCTDIVPRDVTSARDQLPRVKPSIKYTTETVCNYISNNTDLIKLT